MPNSTIVKMTGGGYIEVSETHYLPPLNVPPGPVPPGPVAHAKHQTNSNSTWFGSMCSVLARLARVWPDAGFALKRKGSRVSLSKRAGEADGTDDLELSKLERARLSAVEEAVNQLTGAMKYYIIVLEDKGGVGKSLMVQVSFEAVGGLDRNVKIIDADAINSNMSKVGLSDKKNALKADRKDFEGFLLEAAENLVLGDYGAVIFDSAAGSEQYFNRHLANLAKELKEQGARLIIVRPLTTNPLNQDNILAFGRQYMTPDMGVVLVRNLGQGRTDEDFSFWSASPEREEMLRLGMVEVDFEGAQVLYADIAAACGVSLADIPRKKPEDMGLNGRKLQIALKFFTRPARLYMAKWMLRQTVAFREAFAVAIRRTFP